MNVSRKRNYFQAFTLMLMAGALHGCQSKSPSPPGSEAGDNSGNPGGDGFELLPETLGLLFTAVDKNYQSSRLLFLNASDNTWSALEGSASGDPFIAFAGDGGLLFNRTQENFNFQPFSRNLEFGAQTAFSGKFGDPQAALRISETEWLLSLYTEGALGLFDAATGEMKNKFTAIDFGLPATAELKPDNFVLTMVGNQLVAAFANQAYFWGPEGTGAEVRPAILGLALEEEISVFDFNAGTSNEGDKSRDKSIRAFGPFPVVTAANGAIVTVSLCFDNEALSDRKDCGLTVGRHFPAGDGQEAINIEEHAEVPGQGQAFLNGKPAVGSDGLVFISISRAGTDRKEIIRVDPTREPAAVQSVFEYPAGAAGFDAIYYDQMNQRLYVGDREDAATGRIHIVDLVSGKVVDTVGGLPGFPYAGTFIY